MKKIMLILLALLSVSCSTTKGFKGKADFCGIITDSENRGVSGYTVCIGGNRKSITNDSGIFVFPDVSSSDIHVTGSKCGYEKIDCETFFFDENNFFCMSVSTRNEVLSETEKCIEEKEFDKAVSLLESIDYEDGDERIFLLRSICAFLKGDKRGARRFASKIKQEDVNVDLYEKLLKEM